MISTNAKSAHGVYVADADGDGDLDVFSASVKDHKLAWYENLNGKGYFSPEKIITNTATGAASTCVVDLDGDGDRDILLAAGHETTAPIENIGRVVWFENLTAGRPFELPMISYDRDAGAVTILWNSRREGVYAIDTSVDLWTWEPLVSEIVSRGQRTSFVDANPPATGPRYYRVRETLDQ